MNIRGKARQVLGAAAIMALSVTTVHGQGSPEMVDFSSIVTALKADESYSTETDPPLPDVAKVNTGAISTGVTAAWTNAHAAHGHAPNAINSAIPCVAELALVAERARVNFGSGSSNLSQGDQEAVLVLAAMAADCPQAKVLIEGYADPNGYSALNLTLSWRRANAVLATIKAAGFSGDGFEVYSHLTDHDDAHCKHFDVVDRRAEFIVVPRLDG